MEDLCQGFQLAKVNEEYQEVFLSSFGNYPGNKSVKSSFPLDGPEHNVSGFNQAGTFWDQPIASRIMSKKKSLLKDLDKTALLHSQTEEPAFDSTWSHIENPSIVLPSLVKSGYQAL